MSFQSFIHYFYEQYGRHDLPWRLNHDPYRILVSEIMLQQTQVDRVIPKYLAFLARFPTVDALASASVADVIKSWQGLGYNRRGLNLQRAAQKICTDFSGVLPSTSLELQSLPGVGPYTAAAILAFAFNQPSFVIETNIRTVYIHHFFPDRYDVTDQEVLQKIAETVDHTQPRVWYSALMDYGSYLKSVLPNPTRRSTTYVKQSPFATSNRRLRGLIIKSLSEKPKSLAELAELLTLSSEKVLEIAAILIKEGFIAQSGDTFQLAS